jgi:oxygen-independent coproporphyrinogen-3 oxidase
MAGIYISFPFCAQKCTFCNFASGVLPRELESQYVDALVGEMEAHRWAWTPETVYVGGGTPSRLSRDDLRRVLNAIPGCPWREATIEAAPGSLTGTGVETWVEAGINRVSLGVQSFVKRELERTGRRHDADIVARDCELLRSHGISNINIDLICGLPWQTPETWDQSLSWIERLAPPHVSVYLLEVDEDSRLGLEVLNHGSKYGASAVPAEDAVVEMYEHALERLGRAGIERYEISNFARRGCESLHNLKYWQLEPYAGFGADAHSFDNGWRWSNAEGAAEYVQRWRQRMPLDVYRAPANMQEERFFVGLRLMRGITPQAEEWEKHAESIDRLVTGGLLEREGGTLRLTSRGVLISNDVFQEFIEA